MEKIKKFLKKHFIIVIGILVFLLMLKSCQSCTRKNTIEFNKTTYENQLDSLKALNDSLLFIMVNQHDSIERLSLDVKYLNNLVNELKNDKSYLKSTNIKLNNNIKKVLDNGIK